MPLLHSGERHARGRQHRDQRAVGVRTCSRQPLIGADAPQHTDATRDGVQAVDLRAAGVRTRPAPRYSAGTRRTGRVGHQQRLRSGPGETRDTAPIPGARCHPTDHRSRACRDLADRATSRDGREERWPGVRGSSSRLRGPRGPRVDAGVTTAASGGGQGRHEQDESSSYAHRVPRPSASPSSTTRVSPNWFVRPATRVCLPSLLPGRPR